MDAVKVHAHQALAMTREEALEQLRLNSPAPVVRRMSDLMLAGPKITPEDEARLRSKALMLPPLAFYVRVALGAMR